MFLSRVSRPGVKTRQAFQNEASVYQSLVRLVSRARRNEGGGNVWSLTLEFPGRAPGSWRYQSDQRFKKVGTISRGLSHDHVPIRDSERVKKRTVGHDPLMNKARGNF